MTTDMPKKTFDDSKGAFFNVLLEKLMQPPKDALDRMLDRMERRAIEHSRLKIDNAKLKVDKALIGTLEAELARVTKEWESAVQQIEQKNFTIAELEKRNQRLGFVLTNLYRAAKDVPLRKTRRATVQQQKQLMIAILDAQSEL